MTQNELSVYSLSLLGYESYLLSKLFEIEHVSNSDNNIREIVILVREFVQYQKATIIRRRQRVPRSLINLRLLYQAFLVVLDKVIVHLNDALDSSTADGLTMYFGHAKLRISDLRLIGNPSAFI